ncbi:MAG: YebC/PmpR family DNA-binding transcriptional regulator [Chloroflexota bacterium]|nr:YebC/PmpR family DNA-binding transcriptional regulator [Chloroflexota bacterium]
MSGHSKWSTIKRQKGVADAKRGQLFTKLSREIALAVRQGGGSSPDMNPRLRLAIQKARDQNMPMDNIEKAIKRASGEGEGITLTESTFEGYGPGGVAFLIETLSDNRNRTLQEIRSVLTRGGGSLGDTGSVGWQFDAKGLVVVEIGEADGDDIALSAIDAGAEDVKVEGSYVEVYTSIDNLGKIRTFLEDKGLLVVSAEPSMIPNTTITLDESAALQIMKLIDRLEELDDVQRVSSNADFPSSALDQYQLSAG